jgi:hypothetical protein
MERKFDNKYELMRNKRENGDDKHRFGTLALTKKTAANMHGFVLVRHRSQSKLNAAMPTLRTTKI